MCRDCVWNDYFAKLEKFEAWCKKQGKDPNSDQPSDPNMDMFARLERSIKEKERLKALALEQQSRKRVQFVFDTTRSNALRLFVEMLEKRKNLNSVEAERRKQQQV